MLSRNRYFFLILLISVQFPMLSWAQDQIVRQNGEIIPARVEEITETHVKYRPYDHMNGPLRNLAKSDILSIRYEDGKVERFSAQVETARDVPPPAPDAPRLDQEANTIAETPRSGSPKRENRNTGSRFYTGMHINTVAPYSLYMGSLVHNGTGLYIGTRGSFQWKLPLYECDHNGVTDPYPFEFNYLGNEVVDRFAVTLGFTQNLGRNSPVWAYTGLGYGHLKHYHQYEQWGISGAYYGLEWAHHRGWDIIGLESEIGLILDIPLNDRGSSFNFNGGVVMINEEYLNFTYGFGFAF